MVVFLAGWDRFGLRTLHRHVQTGFEKHDHFEGAELRPAGPRERGRFRVVARTDPRWFLDDPSYPTDAARVEVGFADADEREYPFYWFNWVEPERSFVLGWHRDDHPDLGRVHRQVSQDGTVDRESATFVDAAPAATFYARLEQLPDALDRVAWDGDQLVGFEE